MQLNDRFDPVDFYEMELKESFFNNAHKKVDELIKNSNVSEELNKQLNKELNRLEIHNNTNKSTYNKIKGWQIFLIVLAVFGFIGIIFGIFSLVNDPEGFLVGLTILLVGIAFALIGVLVPLLYTRKKLKAAKKKLDESQSEVNKKLEEIKQQVAPLIASLHNNLYLEVFRNTVDYITYDEFVDPKKLRLLTNFYGYDKDFGIKTSVLATFSGTLARNPYINVKLLKQDMINQPYYGSTTISYRDGDRTVTETLTASVTRPKPVYDTQNILVYGNMAAPDLSFSRYPTINSSMTDAQFQKFSDKNAKKLQKRTDKAVKKGQTFTSLANSGFEGAFNALDRDHENQFRLLFTPLAQQNMIEVLRNKGGHGFGDDFCFFKRKKINYISSAHADKISPFTYAKYTSYYDLEKFRNDIVLDWCERFRSFYFDLCPLLAIPLYQTEEGGEFNIDNEIFENVSLYDAECVANVMDENYFAPFGCATPQILKSSFVKTEGLFDIYSITSHAFRVEHKCTTVYRTAGNGRSYPVTVYYDEYFSISKPSYIKVARHTANTEYFQNREMVENFLKDQQLLKDSLMKNKDFIGVAYDYKGETLNDGNENYDNFEEPDDDFDGLDDVGEFDKDLDI